MGSSDQISGHVPERPVSIVARLLGHAQDSFGYDVALNLVSTAGNRYGRRGNQDLGDNTVHGTITAGQHGIGATDHGVHMVAQARHMAGRQFADGAFRALVAP